ncbi:MAG: hypothetical protein AAF198_00955 [Pseudomonadota bacterium]
MTDQTAIICARIFHDLASPLGAISAGVELAAMSGQHSEETDLMSESARAALAKLHFFKWSFGHLGPTVVPVQTLLDVLAEIAPKITVSGLPNSGLHPAQAKILCLAVGFCLDRKQFDIQLAFEVGPKSAVSFPPVMRTPSDADDGAFSSYVFDLIMGGEIRSQRTEAGLTLQLV